MLDKVRQEGVLRTYRTVKARLEERNAIGYSSAGVVTQVGELAAGLAVGDLVACGGAEYANHAEYAYVPATLCARVPDGVGLDQAAFATVGAVALQGVRQSGATVGDRVAVIGLGLVGQITVQLLRAAGCEVAGADPDAGRCAAVAAFGAVTATSESGSAAARQLAAATGGLGYDAVIITAGTRSDEPVELAGQIARDRGTVVVVGDVGMRLPRHPLLREGAHAQALALLRPRPLRPVVRGDGRRLPARLRALDRAAQHGRVLAAHRRGSGRREIADHSSLRRR